MRDLNQLRQRLLRHQRERAARELQAVHVMAHDIHHVLQVSFSVGGIVGPADLRHAMLPRFGSARVGADEA